MKTAYVLAGVIVLLVVAGLVVASNNNAGSSQTQPSAQSSATTTAQTGTPTEQTVTYDGQTFNPSSITIHAGDTVTFVDSSSNPMWVASGMHPVHTGYDGTDRATHCAAGYSGPSPFDECQASTASYSFTFTKAGTWSYHNHLNPSAVGEVVVE